MTDEQINVKCAEVLGWKHPEPPTQLGMMVTENNPALRYPPNFVGDLNACHEMEKSLALHDADTNTPIAQANWELRYAILLVRMTDRSIPYHATARQRATAFLAVHGIDANTTTEDTK